MRSEGSLNDMADKVVLNFHDSLLRESDVKLLEEGQWLNDNVIAFALEYFEHIKFNDSRIAFVSPSVCQLVKLCSDAFFLESLCLAEKELIFLVVNDNDSRTTVGGSHWSLLLYTKHDNCFSHYDSFHASNNTDARELARCIQTSLHVDEPPVFRELECVQQTNGCDCGVFVISITKHLCENFLGQSSLSLKDAVTSATVNQMRHQLQDLIKKLAS